jgi:nucleoid-associated protein EbfC
MKNMMQMMQKAQKIQQDIESLRQEIQITEFNGLASSGLVKVVINGNNDILDITIADSIVDKEDIVDLIIIAHKNAKKQMQEYSDNKMKELTSGLPLPPGIKIPGLF